MKIGSPEQQAIWSEIENGQTHLIVEARAGTGKTYTLENAASLLPAKTKTIFCAFNKSIERELRARIPLPHDVSTLHAFGLKQVSQFRNGKPVSKRPDKTKTIIAEFGIPDHNHQVHRAIDRLVSLCKSYLYTGETEQLRYLANRHRVDMSADEDLVFPHIKIILDRCGFLYAEEGIIDFDDMIWLPAMFDMPVQTFDYTFVDEAQDLNYCQQRLVMKACGDGRLIVVGDRYQSIYGFRGADSQSMETMKDLLLPTQRSVKQMHLTVTRRCPRYHVALAQYLVSDIKPVSDAKLGKLQYLDSTEKAIENMNAGDIVICRTNAPLVELANVLVQRGHEVMLSGQDIGQKLKRTVDSLKPHGLEDLASKLQCSKQRHAFASPSDDSETDVSDMYDSLLAFLPHSQSVEELQKHIENFFQNIDVKTDTSNVIVLSSVHKAKGLEADRVFLIESALIPHSKASQEWELQQEKNILYVAITRAKKVLFLVGPVSKLLPRKTKKQLTKVQHVYDLLTKQLRKFLK